MVNVSSPAADDLCGRIRHDVDKGLLPGAQVAVAHAGRILLAASFGDVTDSDLLPLYSTTKVLPAAAVWRLVSDGTLRWDQPVVEVLDWFTGGAKERITIEHLLLHTAGLERAPLGPPEWFDRVRRRARMASWYATTTPGEHFAYHATSASWVLAEVVAAIRGTDHASAIHGLVTEPLGLPRMLGIDDTRHPVRDLVPAGHGPLVGPEVGEATDDHLLRFNDHDVRLLGVPGAGGLASASTLALLYQALLHDPEGLWDPAVLHDVTAVVRNTQDDVLRQAPANRTRGLIVCGDDGLGIRRGFGTGNSPRAFGHDGAGGQVAWADPDSGLSCAFLTTALDGDIVRQVRRGIGVSSRAARLLS